MDHERKELLAQKKAQLKVKQQRAEIQQYKDRLTKSIEDFSQKYRYADEAEAGQTWKIHLKTRFRAAGATVNPRSLPVPTRKCLPVLFDGNRGTVSNLHIRKI